MALPDFFADTDMPFQQQSDIEYLDGRLSAIHHLEPQVSMQAL